jgi:methyltransferase
MELKTLFALSLGALIVQRLMELRTARRNSRELLERGAIEHGARHYPIIVLMHTLFFLSLMAESAWSGLHWSRLSPLWLGLFLLGQLGRVWVMKTLQGRWTTRVYIVPGETLASGGPFRYLSHPKYVAVSLEILSFPLAFGLERTSIVFSLLNAAVLLGIRIPVERQALARSQASTAASVSA